MKNFLSRLIRPLTLIICCLVFVPDTSALAQNVAAWHDRQNRFQYYDDGKLVQLDHNPASFFKIGHDFILYFNSQEEMVYYRKGHEELLHLREVRDDYAISRHLVTIKVGGLFTVIDHKENKSLSLQDEPIFQCGDSIVAFIDFHGELRAFYDGEKILLDPRRPRSFKTSENSIAFVDSGELLQFHVDGETVLVAEDPPNDYMPGNDLLLFVEEYDEFYMWRDGELVKLDGYPPKSYKVGRNIAAYINDQESFFIIKEGEIEPTEISPNEPSFYDVVDNTVVFVEDNNFKVYYKGEIHTLESYVPDSYKYADGVVAYTDHTGRLKAFYEGEVMTLTSDIVIESRDKHSVNGLVNTTQNKPAYMVFGRVILYQFGNSEYHIFHNGEEFIKN